MRTRKLLQKTLELLDITREELGHLVSCGKCNDPFDSELSYHCDEYARRFWDWERPEKGSTPAFLPEIQRLWSDEILRQAAPVLRFEQFKEGGENADQEA